MPRKNAEIEKRNVDEKESDSFEGDRRKFVIPSNIIDIKTRLKVLVGAKLSVHNDTLTEASNLIGELYGRGEIQNDKLYRTVLDKFCAF